ncbi:MAG: hypothetical protein ACTSQY_04250 [Candidatus Odinarchaeia archaeon]
MGFLKNKKGSPLVEEGLLVGIAILAIGLLIFLVVHILQWAGVNIDQLISDIGNLLPFFENICVFNVPII